MSEEEVLAELAVAMLLATANSRGLLTVPAAGAIASAGSAAAAAAGATAGAAS